MTSHQKLIFRIIEILLCIAGTVIYELTEEFFSRVVSEGLVLGLGGYVIILGICLIASRIDNIPECLEIMFLGVGFVLNFFCGIMMVVTYSLKRKAAELSSKDIVENKLEATLGCISIIVAIVMLIDVLSSVLDCGAEDDEN